MNDVPASRALPVQEVVADLWALHRADEWIAVPTNGMMKANGDAVMGAGLAKEAAQRYPELPRLLGQALREYGNRPFLWASMHLITVPTKTDWKRPSDLSLICQSMERVAMTLETSDIKRLYLPHLGCGLGQLAWPDVRAAIAPYVTERMIFVAPHNSSR
jgi:hypothetical protein